MYYVSIWSLQQILLRIENIRLKPQESARKGGGQVPLGVSVMSKGRYIYSHIEPIILCIRRPDHPGHCRIFYSGLRGAIFYFQIERTIKILCKCSAFILTSTIETI